MRGPILLPRRGDVLGVLTVLAVTGVLILAYVVFPDLAWRNPSQASFGPDWDCQYGAAGQNVCIKRVPKTPPK